MSFQSILSTVATIVSIVGGVIGIISALSKEPIFLRFWQRQAARQALPSPAIVPPASVPSQSVGEGVAVSHVREQTQQIVHVSPVRVGIVYGVVVDVLAILIIIGVVAVSSGLTYIISTGLAYLGIGMLSVVAGLLPARTSGSLLASIIAGGMLGGVGFLTVSISILIFYLSYSFLLAFVMFGVLPFLISLLFGLLGRFLHNKLQTKSDTIKR